MRHQFHAAAGFVTLAPGHQGGMTKMTTPSTPAAAVEAAMKSSSIERGHRLGNYHNYYFHHPPSNRIEVLEEQGLIDCMARRLLENLRGNETTARKRQKINEEATSNQASSAQNILQYCDLGCNEGNLTMALADAVFKRYHEIGDDDDEGLKTKKAMTEMKCLGLDIDPTLIERATNKFGPSRKSKNDVDTGIDARFEVCNLCCEEQQLTRYKAFLGDVERFDLTTLFSTTMWIHIHAGDDGLRDFLIRTCEKTDMLVVEPQISKCYGRANSRLRKMDRPELDSVSSQTLTMRGNIEDEVEKVILACGFRRVTAEEENKEGSISSDVKRTAWKRQIQLYVRE